MEADASKLNSVLGLLDKAIEAHDKHDEETTAKHHNAGGHSASLVAAGSSMVSPVAQLIARNNRMLRDSPDSVGDASRTLLEAKAKDLAKTDAIWHLSEALKELGRRDAELEEREAKSHIFDRKMKGLVQNLQGLAAQAAGDLRIARIENQALRERVKFLEEADKGERLKSDDPVDVVFQRQHEADLEAITALKEEVSGLREFAGKQSQDATKKTKEASAAEMLSLWLAKERNANQPLREENARLAADRAALVLQVKELTAATAEKVAQAQAQADGISLQAELDDKLRACEMERDVATRNFEGRLKQMEREALGGSP